MPAETASDPLLGPIAARHPSAFGHLLRALDFSLAPAQEVAIVEDGADRAGPLARAMRIRFRPHTVLAGGPAGPPDRVPEDTTMGRAWVSGCSFQGSP